MCDAADGGSTSCSYRLVSCSATLGGPRPTVSPLPEPDRREDGRRPDGEHRDDQAGGPREGDGEVGPLVGHGGGSAGKWRRGAPEDDDKRGEAQCGHKERPPEPDR